MLLDSEKAKQRLNSPNNLVNLLSRKEQPSGTGETPQHTVEHRTFRPHAHAPRIPVEVRNTVAILAKTTNDSQQTIAKEFGISQQAVSDANTGVTPTDSSVVDAATGQIRDVALERLMQTLNLITPKKLDDCKASELSRVGANLASIVEKTTPKAKSDTQVNLVIYAPETRSESHYKTVEVKASK